MAKKFKKEEMIPGKRYKGYGYINDYKQFCFEPEATGSQAGREICLFSKDGVSIKQTKNFLLVNMRINRNLTEAEMAKQMMGKFNVAFNFLKDYEI